jgi:hypothetical protein
MSDTQVLAPVHPDRRPRPLLLRPLPRETAPAPAPAEPRTREAHCRIAMQYED